MLLYKTVLIYILFNLFTSSCFTAEPVKTGKVHGTTNPKESSFASTQPQSSEHYKGYVEILSLLWAPLGTSMMLLTGKPTQRCRALKAPSHERETCRIVASRGGFSESSHITYLTDPICHLQLVGDVAACLPHGPAKQESQGHKGEHPAARAQSSLGWQWGRFPNNIKGES